jgi:FecR protein
MKTMDGWRSPAWPVVAAVALLMGAAGPMPALAQYDAGPQIASERDEVADPPGRAGRLAEVQGSAWLFHPEAGEWLAAERNRPFTSGDRLSTDKDGRAELRVGSTSLRLDANSEMEIVRLDDEAFEVYLHSGSLAVRVRSNESAREFLMTTEDGRFTVQRPGRFRLDRTEDNSQLTVWSGQASFETPDNALAVQPGQRAEFWLDRSGQPQYKLGQPRSDSFAGWTSEMDRGDERSVASRYVSPEMTGAEDLDRYGRWEQDQEHGALWQPREVPVGWAPYAQGHWSWVSPWGWTWVDAAPWGFAPFHYGRWVFVRERWCWAPGRYVARPVYAPALVGWVGGGGGSVSVSIGGGPAVGWFPLAPSEAWFPRYRVSPRYVRTVNGPHFRNGGEIDRWILNPSNAMRGAEYRNRKFHHGTTAVPAGAFEQPARFTPVNPRWRGEQIGRQFDRLPASPVATVAPPPWSRGNRGTPGTGSWESTRDPRQGDQRDGRRDERGGWRRDDNRPGRPPVNAGTPGGAAVIGTQVPRERPVDRPAERPFFGNNEVPVARPDNGLNGGNSDWPSGRSRPALPPGSVIEPPRGAQRPAVGSLPPQAPAARIEAPPAEQRFERPARPERGFERPDRGLDRAPPTMPAETRMPAPQAQPVAPPPPVRAAPAAPLAPPPPPVMAAPVRPPEPARPAAAPPPPGYVPPLQSRRPGESRDQREPGEQREGGRGKPQ